jgi:aspartate aminotransferase
VSSPLQLNARTAALRPSATLAIGAEAQARKARGEDIINFGVGEPDFDTPEFIKAAAIEGLRQGYTKYTSTAGIPELRRAIADSVSRAHNLEFRPEEVIVSCGAKQSLFNLFQAILSPGAEVLIPTPYWVSYPEQVAFSGGTPVFVPCPASEGFRLKARALAQAITPRTRALVINSPNNPTGVVLSKTDLAAIAEVVRGAPQMLLVSDDIYERLSYGPDPFANLLAVAPELRERTVLVSGFSKSFSMTGWRLGYAVGPKPLIDAMQRIQDQSTSNPTSFAQLGALAALQASPEMLAAELGRFYAELDRRRQRIVPLLRAIPGVTLVEPRGAFYAFPDVRPILERRSQGERIGSDGRLCQMLLEQGLVVVPGEPFGAPGHVRFSFALAMADIERGMTRFASFVAGLQD